MSQDATPLPIPEAAEPSSFRLIATLGVAGFLSGLALVGIYLFTKPVIEHNKAEARRLAVFKVLPGTESFKTFVLVDGKLKEGPGRPGEVVYMGLDASQAITGFAISDLEIGFADNIGVIYGYDPGRKAIFGYEVLECKETPGLGDKIFKDENFLRNFKALAVEPEIILVKQGEKTKENEVDAITGATISSRAVVKLLNRTMAKWKGPIDAFMKTQATTQTPEENE